MPSTNIKTRGGEAVKIQEVCVNFTPLKGTHGSVQGNHPKGVSRKRSYRSDRARRSGMGFCMLSGFLFGLSSPSRP